MDRQAKVQAFLDGLFERLQPEIDRMWRDPGYVNWRSDALFDNLAYGVPMPTEDEHQAFLSEYFGTDVKALLMKFDAEGDK